MKRVNWKGLLLVGMLLLSPACAYADEPAPAPSPSPSPSPAAASADEGWYVGGAAGYAFGGGLSNTSFNVTSGTVQATGTQGFSLGNGPSLSAQVGYQWKGPRVEGEFLWQTFDRPATTATVTGTPTSPISQSLGGSRLDTYSLFLNGYYDFNSGQQISPYVGVGVGVTSLNASSQSSNGIIATAPGVNTSVFAYQAKLGLSYNMCPTSSLFLQYRYLGTSGFNYGGARVNANGTVFNVAPRSGSLSNSSVELGVRFKL